MKAQRVVIIGGGFGGLNLARRLKHTNTEVLLIDRTNHHLFQPLLYQVASAVLSPGNIAVPLRGILRYHENTTVLMGNVTVIDIEKQEVITSIGQRYPYDTLVIASGSTHSYFGHEHWEKYAIGLKTLLDARRIREKILAAYERAERSHDPELINKLLRFVIIGGGPTGVEMAGAIAEIAFKTLYENFRHINPADSEIILIEGDSRVLPSYPEKLCEIAKKNLEDLGVEVWTDCKVTNVTSEGVYVGDTLLATETIVWAAGNRASSLLQTLDIPLDKQGRAKVNPDLSIPGHPEVFVIGDAAYLEDQEGKPLPGIAPVAIQQGIYLSKIIPKRTLPEKRPPFKYRDKGSLATIGRSKAVGTIGKIEVSGFIAWVAWAMVHIFYLISFRNRVLVMFQWFFLYLTGGRTVRLVTNPLEEDKVPNDEK